jgi:precorrin-3B synthase
MNAPSRDTLRRGWCPSTLKPMETGDGWLVRLHPPGACLTPAQLRRIAALATRHGNGLIEISARGNMQLRGVTGEGHPELVATLLAERLVDEHDGDGPQRLTLVSPVAQLLPPPACGGEGRGGGPESQSSTLQRPAERNCPPPQPSPPQAGGGSYVGDLIDALALAAEIETRGREIAGLPAKFSVVVDGGGESSLEAFAGDLRIVATAPGRVVIALADRLWFGPVAEGEAAAAVAQAMAHFADRRAQAPDAIRRMGDLATAELSALCDLPLTEPPPQRPAPRRAGLFAVRASHAALIGLPFGRVEAAALDRLARAAETLGCPEIRLSPWRGLAFRGLCAADATTLLESAAADGLITRDDDPRLSVQACAGARACSRAEAPAMADAARLAQVLAPDLAEGLTLHVSGCVKSCARPAASDLTLVGESGRYRIVIGGSARDSAVATLDLSALLTRLQPGQDLHARLIAAGRLSGPTK